LTRSALSRIAASSTAPIRAARRLAERGEDHDRVGVGQEGGELVDPVEVVARPGGDADDAGLERS
jgi:hypothetical protein